MDLQNCENCGKEIPANSIALHEVHCKRNYIRCPDCYELVNKSQIDNHKADFHTPIPCQFCSIPLMPQELKIHECPSGPKICRFCEGKFPLDQFADHHYQCSSRTEQCPKCQKYIQIRDFSHHMEEVDCLGERDLYSERLEKITEEVMKEFSDQPGFDFEAEILKRLSEDQDRVYAEELYKKLMLERSPSRDSQVEEVKSSEPRENEDIELEEALKQSLDPSSIPVIERNISETSWTGISDEDQLMNEAILKSLQEK